MNEIDNDMQNGKTKISIPIMISFLLITVSYYDTSMGLSSVKYIGLIILDYIALKEILHSGKIEISKLRVLLVLTFFYLLSVFCGSFSFLNVINALFYSIQIWVLIFYSKNIFVSLDAILSGSIGCAIAIVISLMYNPSLLVSQSSNAYGRVRIYGIFAHPNTLGVAGMCVFVGSFLFLIYRENKALRDRMTGFVLIVISIVAVIFSNSRNAIYGLILFLILYIVSSSAKRFSLNPTIEKAIYFVAIVIIGYLILINFDSSDIDALTNRIDSVYYLSDFGLKTWIIGEGIVGGGSLGLGWGTEFSLTQIIYKCGLIGLLIYICLFGYMYRISSHVEERQKRVFAAIYVMFLVCCIAEPYIINITNIFPMYFIMLLSALSQEDIFSTVDVYCEE